MKRFNLKLMMVATFSILSSAAFFISLQYSNSSKNFLIKDNIDAISDDGDKDPGKKLTVVFCAKKTYKRPDSQEYVCREGTQGWVWFPCDLVEDVEEDALYGEGHCYLIPEE